uniref:Uncharacterized protein n=1 Tax=Physcomitrium patens TaxID=3218 RepID=A0A2K1JUF5_PHYPA|nr:hypothetical protein PHYPA_014934 [Physcomitrium patens]
MARCAYNNWPNGSGTVGGATGYLNTFALGHEAMTMALSVSLFLGGAACGGVLDVQLYGIVSNLGNATQSVAG